jgi:hypothetical protein
VIQYLETQAPSTEPVVERVRERLARLGHPVVDKHMLQRLAGFEQERALASGLEVFKFRSNREMLEVLQQVSTEED